MRNTLVVLSLALSSLASAQPAERTVMGGVAMAGADLGVDAQVAVEGGYRLGGNVWLHALAASGFAGDDQGGGAIHQVRGGIEGRTCTESNALCVIAGADLGYQGYTWRSQNMSSPDEPHHDLIGVTHLGGDLGGRHVRVRPGLEALSRLDGRLAGVNLTLGVAYQW